MHKHILVATILIAVLGFAATAYYLSQQEPAPQAPSASAVESDHVITLTSDGYQPATLTIARGETVTFRTELGKRHWPASNLHPSHLEYADFDPKAPVAPEESWSFTFEEVGEWRFHDHLAPYYTGTIIVTP